MISSFRKYIPMPIILRVKRFYLSLLDVEDFLLMKPKDLPPRRLARGVGGYKDFQATGKEFFEYFKNFCGLKPSEQVLDIGCGLGRMARPLTHYLEPNARYIGVDIVKEYIDWCTQKISSEFPHFEFHHMDVFNGKYNPTGSFHASKYSFPFPDCTFDFVILTSVFTHMLPPDLENYVGEASRMLKNDGRCLVTFFLLDNPSVNLPRSRKSSFDFKYRAGVYALEDKRDPEYAVAYEETYIRELFTKHNLPIQEPIRHGSWRRLTDITSFQDIVVSKKSTHRP